MGDEFFFKYIESVHGPELGETETVGQTIYPPFAPFASVIVTALFAVPSTPVSVISELLPFVDLVLVMLVNPGFGGQKMIPECVEKIRKLAALRTEHGYRYLISADGGINRETSTTVREAGLDIAVAGSAFFNAEDPAKEVLLLTGRI